MTKIKKTLSLGILSLSTIFGLTACDLSSLVSQAEGLLGNLTDSLGGDETNGDNTGDNSNGNTGDNNNDKGSNNNKNLLRFTKEEAEENVNNALLEGVHFKLENHTYYPAIYEEEIISYFEVWSNGTNIYTITYSSIDETMSYVYYEALENNKCNVYSKYGNEQAWTKLMEEMDDSSKAIFLSLELYLVWLTNDYSNKAIINRYCNAAGSATYNGRACDQFKFTDNENDVYEIDFEKSTGFCLYSKCEGKNQYNIVVNRTETKAITYENAGSFVFPTVNVCD